MKKVATFDNHLLTIIFPSRTYQASAKTAFSGVEFSSGE